MRNTIVFIITKIRITSMLLALICVILAASVNAEIIDSRTEIIDHGSHKVMKVYGSPKFMLNFSGDYQDYSELVSLSYSSNKMTITIGDASVDFVPYIESDKVENTMNKYIKDNPNVEDAFWTKQYNAGYEWGLNITGLDVAQSSKLGYIKWSFENYNNMVESDITQDGNRFIFFNEVGLDVSDLVDEGWEIETQNKELKITNVKDKTHISLDPYIILIGVDEDDCGIVYRNGNYSYHNESFPVALVGTITNNVTNYDWYRYFLKFNTTLISEGAIINSAILGVNFYTMANGENVTCDVHLSKTDDIGDVQPSDFYGINTVTINSSYVRDINFTSGYKNQDVTGFIVPNNFSAFMMNSTFEPSNFSEPSCVYGLTTFEHPSTPYLVINYTEFSHCIISSNPLIGVKRRIPVVCNLTTVEDRNCVISTYAGDTLLGTWPESKAVEGVGYVTSFQSEKGLLHGYYEQFMLRSGFDYTLKITCGQDSHITQITPDDKGLTETAGILIWGRDNSYFLAGVVIFIVLLILIGAIIYKFATR